MDKETERLELERTETLIELKRLRSELETELDRRVDGGEDSVDAAADVYEREKTLAIVRTLELKLESIERALEVARQGTYGICEICGKVINPARLEIVPQATMCVACQAKMERSGRWSARRSMLESDE